MKCKNCQTEFEGNFCPKCATPANSNENAFPNTETKMPSPSASPVAPVQKKGKAKKIILTALGIFVALGVIGSIFGSNDNPPPTEPNSQNGANNSTPPVEPKITPPAELKTEYGINDPATYKNTKLTVTNVEKDSGSTFDTPKSGMEYVIVTVEYENTGSERIHYNPFDFEMQNSNGQINAQAFSISNSETALGSGDLAGGGKVSGTIVFEQAIGDANLTLIYTGSIFSNNEKISFKLQ